MLELPKVRRILYCTQLGPNAAYIFRYAWLLAERFGAKVTALHVVERLSPDREALVEAYAGEGTLTRAIEGVEAAAEAKLKRRLGQFCEKLTGSADYAAVVDRVRVVEGRNTADAILAAVPEEGADLVVVGAHSKSSLLAELMGNTAQRVIRASPVPVLTVQVPEGHQELTFED